jgi:Ca2+-transporting ATPase
MAEAETAVSGVQGLPDEEARARLARFGPNRLVALQRWRFLREALGVVADPMAVMLAVAAGAYLALGETRDGVVLLVALVPVLGVDVLLELRSRSALRKLAAAVSPRAAVVRGGRVGDVPTEEIVPGDALLLREGDVIHADGVVRRAANLALDESQLTGESEPQGKAPLPGAAEGAPQESRFFAGSLVLAGHGVGEVTETGGRTRFGRIARLVAAAAPQPTPLQRRTGRMVRILGAVALGVALAVFLLGWARTGNPYAALLGAVSLAIAAVPEEFPLVFTLFLSLGAWRLSRHGVLVRRLASVETLGSTTVICTDKTGTLTEGRFAVDEHVALDAAAADAAAADAEVLEAAALASEPDPVDPMERAILAHCAEHGLDVAALHRRWHLAADHDFDPVGKHMSHVWTRADGPARIVAKGALEGILDHCRPDPDARRRAEAANADLASRGMRVLAVAARDLPEPTGDRARDERDLSILGLVGFRDPLRPDVPPAIAECTAAGIAVKVVTGDHALTAHAIADAAGVPHADDGIVTGEDLDRLDPAELAERVDRAAIFARVRPEQKLQLVEALAHAGEVVAMTGDGINDAPALRRADIGISLGIRGTEVARGAADLVMLEDDFASLVATVREGRRIYANIQRAFLYLLAFHTPIIGLALAVPLLGYPLLLEPVHLVWLELIVHPVSALVFEAEPAPPDVMRRPPRDPKEPLVPLRLAIRSVASGLVLTAGALWAYAAHLAVGVQYARSLGVAVVVAGSLLLVWAERTTSGSFLAAPLPRSLRFWAVWGAVAVSLPICIHVPAVAGVFRMQPLAASDWGLVLALAAASVAWRAVPWPRRRRA